MEFQETVSVKTKVSLHMSNHKSLHPSKFPLYIIMVSRNLFDELN